MGSGFLTDSEPFACARELRGAGTARRPAERLGNGGQRRLSVGDSTSMERERGLRDRELIRRAASLLAADMSLGELFERLCEVLASYIDASVVFIALTQADGGAAIEFAYDHGVLRRAANIPLQEGSRSLEVMRTGRTIWGNRPEAWAGAYRVPLNPAEPESDDTASAIFVPLTFGSSTIGCLSVQSTRPDAYDQSEVDLIAAIGHYLAVAVENQRMYRALLRTADFDPMTGLVSHSRLLRDLDSHFQRASSTKPVAAIMFNVINFAMFNATFGYPEGDGVLRTIADTLMEFNGESTAIGRFGGDVFLVLAAGRSKEESLDLIGRLAERCRKLAYRRGGQTIPISLACGYAFGPLDSSSRDQLLALCELRCRVSRKQAGRAVGEDDIDGYQLNGSFAGIETIVDSLLDRDPYTRVHLFHVNVMAKHWAEHNLDLDAGALAKLLQASLLHDVGKLLVSDKILVKPSVLSPQEYEAIQRHAKYGRNILAQYGTYGEVADVVHQHHERWDGKGYPIGLAGEDIHPLARAISILDAYSAMTMDRPYHRGIAEGEALEEIARCAGSQFDPWYVERFLQYRRRFAQARPLAAAE